MADDTEDRLWQRLDKWLWCARFLKVRAGCTRWVAEGGIRINRQLTDKPHAKLRPGDVLTLPMPGPMPGPIHSRGTGMAAGDVRVVRVLMLAARRGPAAEARALYEVVEDAPAAPAILQGG